MEFQTAYSETKKPKIMCDPEQAAEQHHQEACDINNILAKYQRTGAMEHRNEYRGEYGAVSHSDFQEAMYIVANAQTMFEELPSTVRQKFEGPGQFYEFVQNPDNAPQLVKMGLARDLNDIASKTPQKESFAIDKKVAEKTSEKSDKSDASS